MRFQLYFLVINKTEKKHLHIPEFVLKRKEMQDLKGGAAGTPGGSALCCDCSCSESANSGCVKGRGVALTVGTAKNENETK